MKPTDLFKQSFFTMGRCQSGHQRYKEYPKSATMNNNPANPQPSRKQIRLFRATQKIITSVFFALLFVSCVSYKTIIPESSGHLSETSPSIASGNFIIITVKNGEKIKFKVTEADSARITGIHYSWNKSKGAYDHLDKIIMIRDIQSIRKRKFSAEKTMGLVITVTLGLILLYSLKPYWGLLN